METKTLQEKLQLIEAGTSIYVKKREINVIKNIMLNLSFRIAKPVTEYRSYSYGDCFSICPSCDASIERTYQRYCSVCGQQLKWISMRKMKCRKNKNIEIISNPKPRKMLTVAQGNPQYYAIIIGEEVSAYSYYYLKKEKKVL